LIDGERDYVEVYGLSDLIDGAGNRAARRFQKEG
jgi:hypothetical protein